MKLKPKLPRVVAASLLIVLVAALASVRQEWLNVPRTRVGPLTAVVPAGPVVRLFALGDSGSGDEAQQKVAQAMEARCAAAGGIDGILLLGDNAYPSGFGSVDDPQWQTKILGPYGGPCLGRVPFYPVLGNHDYRGNPASEIEFTLVNPRWHMPNRFYSVAFGSLLKIVALDSNVMEWCLRPGFCGVDFMIDSLARRDTTWTLLMAHHPLASSSDHGFVYRGGLFGLLVEPYLCQRADAWLSGHSHHLEHLKPEGCRLDLYVAGGGGGELYDLKDRRPDSRFAVSRHGFLELELDAQRMTARYLGDDGAVLDESTKSVSEAAIPSPP
jgi:hypothetical protein